MFSRPLLAITLAALAVPAAVAATIAPPAYRECMKTAIESRERGYIDSLRTFNDEHEPAQEERRTKYVSAYDSELDSEIRDRTRDANREFNQRYSDIRRAKRDRDRDVARAYNDAKKACRDIRRNIEHPPRAGRGPTFGDCGERVCLE